MSNRLVTAMLVVGTTASAAAAAFQERLAQSPGAVLGPDGAPLPSNVVLTRRWDGDVCFATIENRGTEAVRIGSVVLAEFAHALPAETPLYGEGFTMLSQTGGTVGQPVDEGFFTDRQHYRIPEPHGRRTVYGVLTLRLAPERALLLGFTSARRFVGRFSFDANTLSISLDGEDLELAAGATWELEPLLVAEGQDRNALLDRLADDLNRNHPPIFRPPVATGWCSWYCFGPEVTAGQIRGNLAWAKQHFPGLRYIQIDDGYQPWMGDWLETGKSFGGDIRAVLRDIRTEGFEPAIWVAPFVASPQSRLFQEHPDWFVKDAEGKPLCSDRVGFGGWRLGPWYVLDGTHPEAQRWLETLFRTMRSEWGCTYFKLDANYWGTIRGGVHYDRRATRVEAYRRGMEAIRRGAGDAFILGCNHPLWPSLGLIHGSRASMDVSREWHYFAKTGRENLLRGWQNGRLWWNDPDALCLNGQVLTEVPDAGGVAKSIGKASEDEFLFHATLVYATGGMLLAGDDLRTYGEREKRRLDILYPPTGRAMRFASEAFDLGRLRLPEAEMVALLNWQDAPRDFEVPLDGRVQVTELWSGRDLGLHEGTLTLRAVPAHSGRLLRLTPATGAHTLWDRQPARDWNEALPLGIPAVGRLTLSSSSAYLVDGFAWAKATALRKVHPDNGGCYQAALPDRGGYCQRDFVHQVDGAELLGLHPENVAMLRCFATNQTEARGWFTLWEINYDGSPMACDYRDDQMFWRNTAGMFDLLHGARRMHAWTGDPALVEDARLQRFYARTVSEFVAAHDPNGNGIAEGASGNGWGIACTYNELPGVVLAESADSLGTQCRAFEAQAHFLRAQGDAVGAERWGRKAAELRRRFNETWYDADAGRYLIGFDHPGYRPVNAFGYETSWFIPYTALCDPGPRAAAYLDFIHERFQARPSRNLEAWTYLPDVFYAWGQDDRGWNYFKHVLDHRSEYPEVSFTVISQLATRIMGIEPDAPNRSLSTLGHLPREVEWLELDHVPLGPGDLRVRHEQGNCSTTVENHAEFDVVWQALFRGRHAAIAVDGTATPARPETVRGLEVSGVTLTVKPGQRRTATVSQPRGG